MWCPSWLASGSVVPRADDEEVDWPGPKALPGTIALISFFALNAFVQGIRAGV